MRLVRKYGGTSVGSIDLIKNIAKELVELKKENYELVVVVSAMGKTTDHLIKMSKEIDEAADGRELAALLATGEQQTAALLALAIQACGEQAVSLTGFQAGIKTTNSYQKGLIKYVDSDKLDMYLNDGNIVVVTGFQGMTKELDITTLGRGGSDTSAVAIATALKCPCEIYTDVDGIYTVDPRVYKDAKRLEYISYNEMIEMASLGAGVLETRSVIMAKKYRTPLILKKSLSKSGGTTIMNDDMFLEKNVITGISIAKGIIVSTMDIITPEISVVSDIFDILAEDEVNIDMITQNMTSENKLVLSFSCNNEDSIKLDQSLTTIESKFDGITIDKNTGFAKLSVVGIGMNSQSGVVVKIFNVLKKNQIKIHNITTSEISISIIVDIDALDKAVSSLAQTFDL